MHRSLLRPSLPVVLAALIALLLPAAAPAATRTPLVKYPTVSKVSPRSLGIGDTLTISGKGYRAGKRRTTVVFKREGGRAVFVKADTATSRKITLVVPAKLLPYLRQKAGKPQRTRFRVRVLAGKLGRRYTTAKASPVIGPTSAVKGNPDDCDADGVLNARDADDDNDLLADVDESAFGLQSCKADTDADGLSDGWEQLSAIDRNGKAVPAPRRRPFPNPLDAKDASIDHDGDGLTNLEEYVAWRVSGSKLRAADADPYTSRLSYSGGNPTSDGRAKTSDALWFANRDGNAYLSDFERDADGDGIPNMDEFRVNVDAGGQGDDPNRIADYGLFTPIYLTKGAVEGSKDERRCGGVNQVPYYCLESAQPAPITVSKVDTLDFAEADTDGDGVRDDADDVDYDGHSNMSEYLDELRGIARGDRRFRHLNACLPDSNSRFCLLGSLDIDRDGLENRDDTDDDGDLLTDVREGELGTDPLLADTDGDDITDGYEYLSALDYNSLALPYPGKRPYPNPLDKSDRDTDFDQDVLTLFEEYRAWRHTGAPVPLSYSDGTQTTGGGTTKDGAKDVDGDGLDNYLETHGPLSAPKWWNDGGYRAFGPMDDCFGGDAYTETPYPGITYLGMDFVDPDTDGDGLADGADDIDHDGFTNAQESGRSFSWCTTYESTKHAGTDRYARMQPFNPCKPIWSAKCHVHPPMGYYQPAEDPLSPYDE